MLDDDAAISLIKRFVEATEASGGDDHKNSSDECNKIIEEMRGFLINSRNRSVSGWQGGKDSGSYGERYGACSVHGDEDDEGCDDQCNNIEEIEEEANHDATMLVYVSIGSPDNDDNDDDDDDEQQVLINGDEIDLSGSEYTIGDAGCIALCNSLTNTNTNNSTHTSIAMSIAVRALCVLDLEANGLSSVGGSALAAILQKSILPNLTHLNLGCNGIGPDGAIELAAALSLHCCPLLLSLDLHGNAVGDDGCVAIGAALSAGAVPLLDMLDLSANRIEDRGCMALAPLFGFGFGFGGDRGSESHSPSPSQSQSCCPLMTRLNLRENGIESVAVLFMGATTMTMTATTTFPSFIALDLSWNCIASFEALSQALAYNRTTQTSIFPSLLELNLKGNSLSDAGCVRLCTALRNSGATPHLIVEGGAEGGVGGGVGAGAGSEETIVQVQGNDCGVGEGRLRSCLQLLADGDATNSLVCSLALWENTSNTSASTCSLECECVDEQIDKDVGYDPVITTTTTTTTNRLPKALANEMLQRDGFIVQPPIASDMKVAHLADIMQGIENAGWPPVFCFMSDAIWDFVADNVWPVVRDLLGEDCVLDAGSAFAWSLKATGKSTFPRDGEFRSWQNAVSRVNTTVPKERDGDGSEDGHRGFGSSFGLPHRDYSAAESLHHAEGEDGSEDGNRMESPEILTVWIPLNNATLNNGCMYVVPREFDTDFARTDNHHAHMNPATEVQRGLSSKIHFPLHGVRALPAPAGSLLAWYGNTIHWGSTCSRYADVPRKSIALTFRRTCSSSSSSNSNLGGTKEAPPITMAEASFMTPELRLALISRSLLLYNQWHALADDAVPSLIYETTAISKKRQTPCSR